MRLTIYNIIGMEVLRLFEGRLGAGSYRVEFDAGDLLSGIYFYRLDAGDFVDIRKMVLIK